MKIFVRYSPGGAGNFLCGVVYQLMGGRVDGFSAPGVAHNLETLYTTHNYNRYSHKKVPGRDWDFEEEFIKYTEDPYNERYPDIDEGVAWFKSWLQYNEQGIVKDRHIVRTHVQNLNSLVVASDIADSRILNITQTPEMLDQIVYNFVTKAIWTDPTWIEAYMFDTLEPFHYHFPERTDITAEYFAEQIRNRNLPFVCWMVKYAWRLYWGRYERYQCPPEFNTYNIMYTDLVNNDFHNRVDEIARFLDIVPDSESLARVHQYIDDYLAPQTLVPFQINFNDF